MSDSGVNRKLHFFTTSIFDCIHHLPTTLDIDGVIFVAVKDPYRDVFDSFRRLRITAATNGVRIEPTAEKSKTANVTIIAMVINFPVGESRIGFGSTLITIPLAVINTTTPPGYCRVALPSTAFLLYCTAFTAQKERNATPVYGASAHGIISTRSGYGRRLRWCGAAGCRPSDDRLTRRA